MTSRWWARLALCCPMALAACDRGPAPEAEKRAPEIAPLLRESWETYKDHFIQADGRVIDHSADGVSTSEGQSYAMLRAVWMNDRETFDRAYRWAVDNLNSGARSDALWGWKWGRSEAGEWRLLDAAFASDADEDVALALILAARRWDDKRYLDAARRVLRDLWALGAREAGGHIYLLAGDTLCEGRKCRINPSYYAPYAYRVFAAYDEERPWLKLVDSSYELLNRSTELTATGLPPDWIVLDLATGELTLGTSEQSRFSYDALRTYWRIAMDYELNAEPRARRYLEQSLQWTLKEWKRRNRLPAAISAKGEPRAGYEAPEMLAALMAAFKHVDPGTAEAMRRRLNGMYRDGFWSKRDRYYIQNWAWFGNALHDGSIDIFRH
jgi:endoglucanase